jgi:hypothetical protein
MYNEEWFCVRNEKDEVITGTETKWKWMISSCIENLLEGEKMLTLAYYESGFGDFEDTYKEITIDTSLEGLTEENEKINFICKIIANEIIKRQLTVTIIDKIAIEDIKLTKSDNYRTLNEIRQKIYDYEEMISIYKNF